VIRRLRSPWSSDELAELYPETRDHRQWRGHRIRVEMAAALARSAIPPAGLGIIADLSCGDGAIVDAIGARVVIKGDLAPGYDVHGPIEKTVRRIKHADLFVCSETLEHLDEPELVLASIRAKATRLLVTTPIGAWFDGDEVIGNPEHYWAWDREGVEELLVEAGWSVDVFASLDTRPFGDPYIYGLWVLE